VSEDITQPDLSSALDQIEANLLGEPPSLTRVEVSEQAGVPLEMAQELWRLLGFAHQEDDVVAFTPADVQALVYTRELMKLGVLSPDRQAALVRTWGRSYARLAEWQTKLLTDIALESDDPVAQISGLAEEVLPRVGALQDYVWRRHLFSATSRMLASGAPGAETSQLAVVFCDIVGFTSRSKELDEADLVSWIEYFEAESTGLVVDHGGRIIKNIGDEVLFVSEDVAGAADTALTMVARGADPDDQFPEVRAGLAYGDVVSRLGDVFGPTVNIAARLTSIARPGSVLTDDGAHEALDRDDGPYRFRRLHRTSVKGYSRLQPWALRRAD
jgi:adenylate cyclase